MDPDATLKEIRAQYRNLMNGGAPHARQSAEILAEKVLELDEWLSGNGYLPEAWAGGHNVPGES